MLLYIYLTLQVLVGLFIAAKEADDSRKDNQGAVSPKKSPKRITKEFFGTFGIVQLLGLLIGCLFFGILATLARVSDGPQTVQVTHHDVYKLAPNTKFENTDKTITFTFVNDQGTLEAKHVEMDSLRVFDADNEVLIVSQEDVYRKWLFPWAMDHSTTVSIH